MPVVVQWVCDRDGATASSEGAMAPEGWSELNCTLSNADGGVDTAHVALCPTCTGALPEWLGGPVFAPRAIGRSVVPIETDGAPGDKDPPPPADDTGGISEGAKP